MNELYSAASLLPQNLCALLIKIPENAADNITEIRLRANRPIVLTHTKGFYYLTSYGLSNEFNNNAIETSATEITECFNALCGYSVYSMETSINNGYISLAYGHRAGVCGTGFYNDNGFAVKSITSINVRIARSRRFDCPNELKNLLCIPQIGLLIIGMPSSGKTTVLKGIISQLSDFGTRVSVIDERCELLPANSDLPPHCDVFSAYPKAIGMLQAIRSMSPQVIVCDEIGGAEDAKAITTAANCGVGLIMSMHASSLSQLLRRPQAKIVINTGVFTHACVLSGAHAPSQIERIEEICLR